MSYCHKCGKRLKEDDSFCSLCGARIKEILEDVQEEVEEIIKKTSHKGFIIFIIFLVIVGYVVLDLWAMSQLTPLISISSIWASISNSNVDVSLSQTYASSTIRVENPTFVPVIFARISYDANYGNSKVADGKTGFFILGPYSQKDIPVDLTIYHFDTLKSGLKWIWDSITGTQERKYANVYLDIGITKFRIKTIE